MKGFSYGRRASTSCGSPSSYHDMITPPTTRATIINIEPDEKTPLLGAGKRSNSLASDSTEASGSSYSSSSSNGVSKKGMCEVRLVVFVLFLATGFVIATYLLIAESRMPNLHFTLDLVHRDIWSNMGIPLSGVLNYTNVLNIIITQTNGDRCDDPENCLALLRQLQVLQNFQQNHAETGTEVPYNFLIGGDRQTYEVRGWDFQSGFQPIPQNSSLVIGFIGDYTFTAPSAIQLKSALSLISESLRRKKLQSHYKLYGLRNVTLSRYHGSALFEQISRWPHFDTLLHVL